MSSPEGGAKQRLTSESIAQWGGSSAFFNGGSLEVTLHAARNDRDVFFEIDSISAGKAVSEGPKHAAEDCVESGDDAEKVAACDGVDERVRTTDPAVGRLVLGLFGGGMTTDCTAWIASNNAFITAGHCIDAGHIPLMVEFNVPDSDPDGTINFADPDDQYPIDVGSIVYDPLLPWSSCGNDWGVLATFPNSNTQLRAVEAQQAFYRVTNTTNLSSGHQVRITGHGRDNDPPGTGPHPHYNSDSQTLQTDDGDYIIEALGGWHISEVDIAGGNSGSPLIDLSTGLVLGIQTHGTQQDFPGIHFCRNCSQSFEVADVADAINSFPGANTVYVDATHPEPLEDGSLFRPYDTISEALAVVPSGGVVSIAPGDYFGALTVGTNITFEAPVGSVSIHDDLTVASGATMVIPEGTDLRFAPGKRIRVYGTLNIEGTSTSNVDITSTTAGNSWSGVYFANGSAGTIRHANLSRLSGGWASGAVTIAGNSSPSIEHSTIDVLPGSYVFGVSSTGSFVYNNPKIYKSAVRSASGPALYAAGSGGAISVHDSDIVQTSSNPAARAENSGLIYAWIAATIYDGKNKVKGGRLYASSNAILNFGDGSGSKDDNHFCDAAAATLEVDASGTIYAKYDFWPGGGAPTQINNGGSIFYSDNQGASDCTDMVFRGGERLNMTGQPTGLASGGLSAKSGGQSDGVLFQAKALARAGQHLPAFQLLRGILDGRSPTQASAALVELGQLLRTAQLPAGVDYLKSLAQEVGPLGGDASLLLAGYLASQSQGSEAATTLRKVMNEHRDTHRALSAGLSLFYLHFDSGEFAEAARVLADLKPTTENQTISLSAAEQLLRLEGTRSNTPNGRRELFAVADATERSSRLEVSVYPNPFNPRTVIHYTLSESAFTTLRVYDLLGREVATLVDAVQSAGDHHVSFDASDLPTGTYVYRLSIGGTAVSGTLVLLR